MILDGYVFFMEIHGIVYNGIDESMIYINVNRLSEEFSASHVKLLKGSDFRLDIKDII